MPKEKREDAPRSDSRRRFTKTLAAAFVTGAAVSAATAQTPPAAKESTAPPNPQTTPTPQQQQPPKPSPVAVAYAEVARARFGERLSAEQFDAVKRDLEGNVRASDALRAYKLQNSDEPDFVFGA